LFIIGREAPAFCLGYDLGIGLALSSGPALLPVALRSLSLRSGSLRATGSKAAGAGAGTLWLFMCKRIFLALHCN
jgi:hypothetical protein